MEVLIPDISTIPPFLGQWSPSPVTYCEAEKLAVAGEMGGMEIFNMLFAHMAVMAASATFS